MPSLHAKRKSGSFDAECVSAWLRDTNAGRSMSEQISREAIENLRGLGRCLILLHSDGWVEGFADNGVDLCLCVAPTGVEDRVIEALLPRTYRDLYRPVSRKAAQCGVVTLDDLIERAVAVELVNECFGRKTRLNGRTLGVVS